MTRRTIALTDEYVDPADIPTGDEDANYGRYARYRDEEPTMQDIFDSLDPNDDDEEEEEFE